MNISRRTALLGPFAMMLAPTAPKTATAATTTPAALFADAPVQRAALDHMIGVVQRAAKEITLNCEYLKGPRLALSDICYMQNGGHWDTVDIENQKAIEQSVLRTLELVENDVRLACNGNHPTTPDCHTSKKLSIEHFGFGAFPVLLGIDGTPETGAALEALLLPRLEDLE